MSSKFESDRSCEEYAPAPWNARPRDCLMRARVFCPGIVTESNTRPRVYMRVRAFLTADRSGILYLLFAFLIFLGLDLFPNFSILLLVFPF